MKHLFFLTLLFALIHTTITAQPACTVKYQAVARDADDNVLPSRTLGVQIKVLANAPNGVEIYIENHTPTTSSLGLFNLEIGAGESISGVWQGIDWSTTTYYMEILMDLDGGSDYKSIGFSPILAVPVASYAKNSTPQCLEFKTALEECGFEGQLSITGKEDTFYLKDLDPWNELQSLRYDQQTNALILSDVYGKLVDTIVIPGGGAVPDPLEVTKVIADTSCITNEEENTQIVNDGNRIYAGGDDFEYSLGLDDNILIDALLDPAMTFSLEDYAWLITHRAMDTFYLKLLPGFSPEYQEYHLTMGPFNTSTMTPDQYAWEVWFANLAATDQKVALSINTTPTSLSESWYDCTSEGQDNTVCRYVETRCIGPNTSLLRETNGGDGARYNCSHMNDGGEEALECSWQIDEYNISEKAIQIIVSALGGRLLFRDRDNNINIRMESEDGTICANEYKTNIPQENRSSEAFTTMYSTLSMNAEVSTRGQSQLSAGTMEIQLDDHFTSTVDMTSMTVTLTSHSAETYGLAVIEKNETGFLVKELAGGAGDFGFDWEVKCDRLPIKSSPDNAKKRLEDLDQYIAQKESAIAARK